MGRKDGRSFPDLHGDRHMHYSETFLDCISEHGHISDCAVQPMKFTEKWVLTRLCAHIYSHSTKALKSLTPHVFHGTSGVHGSALSISDHLHSFYSQVLPQKILLLCFVATIFYSKSFILYVWVLCLSVCKSNNCVCSEMAKARRG